MISDLEADKDTCAHCGRLLCKHYGGHELYPTLRFYDGDIVDAVVADVTCGYCGYVNEISWWAQLPTSANMAWLMAEQQRRRRPPAPTTRRQFGWAAAG